MDRNFAEMDGLGQFGAKDLLKLTRTLLKWIIWGNSGQKYHKILRESTEIH
jgi:hypothetical protein